jgi:hypothetical protein
VLDRKQFGRPLAANNVNSAERVNFLPHAPGGVNYYQTDEDVLSGIFTGCVMSIYKHNDTRRVAHVHTGNDAGPNLDCKDFMRELMEQQGYNGVFHFKPFDGARDEDKAIKIAQQTQFGAAGCGIFGFVTATNHCYSIFTRKTDNYVYVIEECVNMDGEAYDFT